MLFTFLPLQGLSQGCSQVLPQGQDVGPCDFQVVPDMVSPRPEVAQFLPSQAQPHKETLLHSRGFSEQMGLISSLCLLGFQDGFSECS